MSSELNYDYIAPAVNAAVEAAKSGGDGSFTVNGYPFTVEMDYAADRDDYGSTVVWSIDGVSGETWAESASWAWDKALDIIVDIIFDAFELGGRE